MCLYDYMSAIALERRRGRGEDGSHIALEGPPECSGWIQRLRQPPEYAVPIFQGFISDDHMDEHPVYFRRYVPTVTTWASGLALIPPTATRFFISAYSCRGKASSRRRKATSPTYGRTVRTRSVPACVSMSPTSPSSESRPRMHVEMRSSGPAGRKATTRWIQSSLWRRAKTAVSRLSESEGPS